eukprot:TRINITY_DN24994_c0_g1_i2.p1 TRINITY_DN24994_c0_g1~~TRINITY_DN24994_c0_g1_i2.p1  ORF type:complete len:854 (-),score=272.22 TRINITY_DN24994_c0_g1_i2:124-2685(-)
MMYLFIKEVAEATNPNDVIIVTSSLTKDMNSSEDLYRANSIRVLARIIDSAMLGAIERYVKQAINDKNAIVASSALVSGISLFNTSPDVVKRWNNEVQEALSSPNEMVQFHALALLYQAKQQDLLAVTKLVTQLTKGNTRSPLAVCLLIRYTTRIVQEDLNAANARAAYQFLESSLRHKNEIVVYEAARAICHLPGVEMNDLSPAITVLQLFLSSPKPTLRFGAMRTLSDVAGTHPMAIVKCNEEMETLISDANRSIATLAITTLLKTGTEGSVDRLMKQISTFMNEIADEFKIIVVHAIRQLCLRYPQKHRVLVGFLATFLREEGGFDFKKAITDCIVELMSAIPDTKETSLFHLCDFIEDCEYTALSTQILHLVGALGPSTSAPARYIRFIYNRVILENAAVRAAAVSSLAKFAAKVPSLRPSITVLLKRSLADEDDEVRDRATVAIKLLASMPAAGDGDADAGGDENHQSEPVEEDALDGDAETSEAAHLMLDGLPMSFASLERAVGLYALSMQSGTAQAQPLLFSTLPVVEEHVPAPVTKGTAAASKPLAGAGSGFGGGDSHAAPTAASAPATADPTAELYKIPELAALGRVFRSTAPVPLTESETEYVVRCVKHIFDAHVVLDFSVHNTIADQMLTEVGVTVEGSEPELYSVVGSIPLPTLKYDQTGHCYVVLSRATDVAIEPVTFTCELHFKVVDCDPQSGEADEDAEGFPEEYPLEEVELSTSDCMAKVNVGDFRRSWEQMGPEGEVLEKFALQFRRLDEAVAGVLDFLGMQPCDGTAAIKPTGTSAGLPPPHTLHLSGVFVGSKPVLVRAQLAITQSNDTIGCVLKIAVRSDDPDVSRMVADCIR